MYAGEVVETGPVREIFNAPKHPDTRRLIECDPGHIKERSRRLPTIPGEVPVLANLPQGCVLRDRCLDAVARCAAEPPALEASGAGRTVACWLAKEAVRWRSCRSRVCVSISGR